MKMNGRKMLSLAIVIFSCISGMYAASNERGIDLYSAELYDAAKIFFLEQRNQSPQEQAENYYYLGQTYYELQKQDSAKYYYTQAVSIAPNYPFGYIGEGKIALEKGDVKAAEALFKTAVGLAKKDPSVQTAIAETYGEKEMYKQAEDALSKAEKINKKYSGIFMVRGSIALKQGKREEAYGWYEQAIYFDPNDKLAYLKLAEAYEDANPTVALEYLDKLTAIAPDYIPAYALIGDINRNNGMYLQALSAYEKFISITGVPLLQHERYAQLLYFTDQYQKSLEQIDYVLKKDPKNPVMHRLQAYNNYKLENYPLALEQMTQFLQENPVDTHIYLDYMTYGYLLMENKHPELAIGAFETAANLDPTKSEAPRELVKAYEAMDNYPEVIRQWGKYFEIEKAPTVFDFFNYGTANYSAASKYIGADYLAATVSPEQKAIDNADFQSYFQKGDSAFAEVISRSPESYLGYLWRARLNSFVDLKEQSESKTNIMQGAAKPYYEEALAVMLNNNTDGKRNEDIIEAYRYLASYYILLDDTVAAGDYFKKILEIDPENTVAKDALDTLKIKY